MAVRQRVKSNTTEAQVVQLADGSVMINCRDNRGGARSVYTTTDLGKTWAVYPSSRSALPEPVCNAGLLRHRDKLFFSNPPQTRGRHHMTVNVSSDEGKSWPKKMAHLDRRTPNRLLHYDRRRPRPCRPALRGPVRTLLSPSANCRIDETLRILHKLRMRRKGRALWHAERHVSPIGHWTAGLSCESAHSA